jgi:hypothetical protein
MHLFISRQLQTSCTRRKRRRSGIDALQMKKRRRKTGRLLVSWLEWLCSAYKGWCYMIVVERCCAECRCGYVLVMVRCFSEAVDIGGWAICAMSCFWGLGARVGRWNGYSGRTGPWDEGGRSSLDMSTGANMVMRGRKRRDCSISGGFGIVQTRPIGSRAVFSNELLAFDRDHVEGGGREPDPTNPVTSQILLPSGRSIQQ